MSGTDRYRELKAAGICPRCGKNPARPGRVMCAQCGEIERAHAESKRMRRRADGLCIQCGKAPAEPGHALCRGCREYTNRYSRDHYLTGAACDGDCENCRFPECILEATPRERAQTGHMKRVDVRKAAGLCVRCGNEPAMPGRTRCAGCIEAASRAAREKRLAWKAAGLCARCGKAPAAPGADKCEECAAKARKSRRMSYANRTLKGICGNCGKAPAAEGHVMCPECLAKKLEYERARRAGGVAQAGQKPAPDHPWRQDNRRLWRRKEEDR